MLAGAGFSVESVDISAQAINEARARHPSIPQQLIDDPTRLPYPDGHFDLVWCIDSIEQADHPESVIAELARVTAPLGYLVLDTLNNTFLSRLVYLRLFQQVPGTKVMPAQRYRADRLRTPGQLGALCTVAGLDVERTVGYEPASAAALISSLLARRRGRITDRELASRAGFKLSDPAHTPPVTYYLICRRPSQLLAAP